MPTLPMISMVRLRASAWLHFWCFRITVMICLPMVMTGFRLVMGSWNTVAMRQPRICCQSLVYFTWAQSMMA